MRQDTHDHYDVIVIGGGAAGLGGALMLARSRRSVVVVDGGQPRNAPAAGVHGYLTRDGITPAQFARTGRLEVEGYGGRVLDGQVEQVERLDDGRLVVTLNDGRRLTGRRLLIATGLVDELPRLPGIQERWGRDVLHCPYCHGWEVRDQAIAVLASGPQSVHQALMFRQLSGDVTFVTHTLPPTDEQHEQLRARDIRVVNGTAAGLQVENDRLTGVRLADGHVVPCTALVVATQMRSRTGFLAGLGLAPAKHAFGVGDHLMADPQGRTEASGVWVAGNVTDLGAQVGASASAGAAAGAAINGDLVLEDTWAAVEAHRADAPMNPGLIPDACSAAAR
jgi:thioredoxin reductase